MSNPEYVVKISGRNYPLKVTANSVTKLQQQTGIKFLDLVQVLAQDVDPKKAKQKGYQMQVGKDIFHRLGFMEIQALFYLGLEGGRRPPLPPYIFEDAGSLMDECNSIFDILQPAMGAFTVFMPKVFGTEPISTEEEGTDSKKASTSQRKISGKSSGEAASK